jgi:NTE family protein
VLSAVRFISLILNENKYYMIKNSNIGLVLSGGGARGAYQIGVWRAMRELGLESRIGVVAGASIGAINGALIAQQDWNLALDLWQRVQPNQIFDADFNYKTLAYDWMTQGGIRVEGLKTIIRTHLSEQDIRQSPIIFGLVVYNKTLRKGQSLFTDDIPQGLLAEYVIASATFPVFQPHRIGDDLYLDGGLHSILPIEMAAEQASVGTIIGVDVAEASRFLPQQWRLRWQHSDRLIYIRPSKMLPSPMNFSERARTMQLELGYRDGIKILQQKLPLLQKFDGVME